MALFFSNSKITEKKSRCKNTKTIKEIMTFIKDMENFAKRLKQLIDTIEIKPAALSLSMGWVTLMTVTPFDYKITTFLSFVN